MHELSCLVVLAMPGADQPSENKRNHPTLHVHNRRSGEVAMTVTETKIDAELGKPATAPNPVTKKRIHDRSDTRAIDHEGGESPSLGSCSGRNRRGGIHKHHLEKEESEGRRIITGALQKEPLPAEHAERFSEKRPGNLVIKPGVTAHRANRADTAKHKGKAADVETQHAHGINHKVHRHGVAGILGAAQTGFHQGETCLHEHHEKAGDQRPHEVNRDSVVANVVGQFNRERFEFGLRRVIVSCLFRIRKSFCLCGVFGVVGAEICRCAYYKARHIHNRACGGTSWIGFGVVGPRQCGAE
jgi:hypothetical protein